MTRLNSQTQPEARQESERPLLDRVIEATRQATVTSEMLQMRLENESIMSECRVRPRDFEAIKAELESQVKAFPALAQEAIYCKPVGADSGKQKFARGLSIRAAEVLAEAYGWCRVRSDITPIDNDRVKVEATFTDFQKGRIWQDGGIISQLYRAKGGGMVRTSDDRFYNVVCKAEVSKRIREVVLRCVNAGLKAWFEDYCEAAIEGILDEKTITNILIQFEAKGATREMLERMIGRPLSMGWTVEDKKKLIGVWNALKNEETSLEEIFGAPDAEMKKERQQARAAEVKAKLETAGPPEPTPESAAPEPEKPAVIGVTKAQLSAITAWKKELGDPITESLAALTYQEAVELEATLQRTVEGRRKAARKPDPNLAKTLQPWIEWLAKEPALYVINSTLPDLKELKGKAAQDAAWKLILDYATAKGWTLDGKAFVAKEVAK